MPLGPLTTDLVERLLRPDGRPRPPGEHRELLRRLHAASCLPVFYHYCKRRDLPLPDFARRAWKRHRTRQLLYRRELVDVLELLDDLPVAVLKGEPLAEMLFDDGRLRLSVDIDLLVAPADLDDALARLADAGWTPPDPDAPFDAWGNNQRRLSHEQRDSKLEVHWRIAYPYVPAPATDELLDHLHHVDLRDHPVPTLDVEHTLVQICYNFHHDQGTLKALLDTTAWLDRYADTADLATVTDTLERHAALGLLAWPLETLRHLDLDPPPAVDRLPAPPNNRAVSHLARRTARHLHRRYLDLAPPTALDQLAADLKPLGTLAGTLRQSVGLTVFSDWHRHPRRLLEPVVLGRHRFGRRLAELLGLPDRPD